MTKIGAILILDKSWIMLENILFFIVAFISEVIGAIAGFGSSTIFLPLALFFVDFQTALILLAISHLFGNLGRPETLHL